MSDTLKRYLSERDGHPKMLTVKEVSELYFQGKVSEREIYALFASGALRGFRVGNGKGKILIYESSLDAYRFAHENHAPVEQEPPAPPAPSRGRAEVPPIRLKRLPE